MYFCFGISRTNSTAELVFIFARTEDIDEIQFLGLLLDAASKEEILKDKLKESTLITTYSKLLWGPICDM